MAFTRPKDWHSDKIAECLSNRQIAEWLTSNPCAEQFRHGIPVMVVLYDYGMKRWPIVPEPPSPQPDPEAR